MSVGIPGICRSRISLPAPLCSPPVTAVPRSYGRSDSCAAALRLSEHEHRPWSAQVSLLHTPRRRDHSVATHLMLPHRRFRTLPFSAMHARVGLHPQSAGSSGTSGRIAFVTTSGCSPPRFAATRLPSVSRPESVCLRKDFHLPDDVRSKAHRPAREAGHADERRRRKCKPCERGGLHFAVASFVSMTAGCASRRSHALLCFLRRSVPSFRSVTSVRSRSSVPSVPVPPSSGR
jgi:hypothetical protein